MTRLSVVLFVQIFPLLIFAQQNKFDSIFGVISLESIHMDKALSIADSLYNVSTTDEQRVRVSILSASFNHKIGNNKVALDYAKRAESIAEQARLHNLHARVCGLISTIYRVNNLQDQGKFFLEKALKSSKKINDEEESFRFQGNLHQEMAYYEMDSENYKEAINILLVGNDFFDRLSNYKERMFLLATNQELIAKCYFKLKNFDKALSYYQKGIFYLKESEVESALEGFIYNGMGNVSMEKNDTEKAMEYYSKALQIAENSKFLALQEEVYLALTNYYKIMKDGDNYVKYNEKYLKILQEFGESSKQSANLVLNEMRTREKSAIFILYTTIGICFLIFSFFIGCYFYIRKKRIKDVAQFKTVINELQQKNEQINITQQKGNNVEESQLHTDETSKEFVSAETANKILEKLKVFESSNKFLEKGYTLAMLAVELDTNTKYLSYIIKNYKNCDFNYYINKLRIDYILKKLHDEPIYSNYKISYLANECGFSSHSKFTTTFKNITGVAPTVFLSLLKKEKTKPKDL